MTEAPSLLELARARIKRPGTLCTVGDLVRSHPEAQGLLDNTGRTENDEPRGEGIPYTVTAETLTEAFGKPVDYQPVSRHVRGKCACR